jgi:hypothetical protein
MTEDERIEAEVNEFIIDRRHLAYIQNDRNQALLLNYLEENDLAVSAASLHAAYEALADELELYPKYPPAALPVSPPIPSQPPAPVPTAPDPRSPQMYRNGRAIPYANARSL